MLSISLLNSKFVTLIILFLLKTTAIEKKHPLHVSTAEFNYNPKEKTVEISCKLFTDDFENILSKLFKQKIDLSKAELKKEMDLVVKNYLLSHLKLKVNGKAANIHYLGFEIDHEATNIYLESQAVASFKSAEVENSILYDLFEDQMSIIHFTNGPSRKSGQILFPNKYFTANF